MSRVFGVTMIVLLGIISTLFISCDEDTNPAPVTGRFLSVSALPDSIANTGATSAIYAIVRDLVDSSQVGGLHLEFSATIGNITGVATSSATDPTGIDGPPYVYFSCQSCPDTITEVIIQGSVFEEGELKDTDTTRVVVYAP